MTQRVQVVHQSPDVVLPVVGTQRAPGKLADAVEWRRQVGGRGRRRHPVTEQGDKVRATGQRVGHFATDGVGGVIDAPAAAIIARRQQLRRQQQQEYRPSLQRLRDFVAPTDAGAQIILVQEDLVVAEDDAEIARQGGRLVLAV